MEELAHGQGGEVIQSVIEAVRRGSAMCRDIDSWALQGSIKKSTLTQLTLLPRPFGRNEPTDLTAIFLKSYLPAAEVTWGTSPEDVVAITGKVPDPNEELGFCELM